MRVCVQQLVLIVQHLSMVMLGLCQHQAQPDLSSQGNARLLRRALRQLLPQALQGGCVLLQLGACQGSLQGHADAPVLPADGLTHVLSQLAQLVGGDL